MADKGSIRNYYNDLKKLFSSGPVVRHRVANKVAGPGNVGVPVGTARAFLKHVNNAYASTIASYGSYNRLARYCLSGDTLAWTPRGAFSMEELCEKYPNGEKFEIYSYDKENNKLVIGTAHHPHKTMTAETIKLTLDNGTKVTCTPNHNFLMRDGTYIEAQDIQINEDSLMPFHRKDFYGNGYQWVYAPGSGWSGEHKVVREWAEGREQKENEVVHHIDRNPGNNSPENLMFMDKHEHYSMHSKESKHGWDTKRDVIIEKLIQSWDDNYDERCAVNQKSWDDHPERKIKASKNIKKHNETYWTEENRKKHSEKMTEVGQREDVRKMRSENTKKAYADGKLKTNADFSKHWVGKKRSQEFVDARSGKNARQYRNDVNIDTIEAAVCELGSNRKEIAKKLGCDFSTILRRIKSADYGNWGEFLDDLSQKYYNHKVIKIEKDIVQDVYDVSVDKYHNFAIGDPETKQAIIFVHNSDYNEMECLAPDTLTRTVEYGWVEIQELSEKHQDPTSVFHVYSWDHELQKVVTEKAFNARKTKEDMTYRVEFNDGGFIVANSTHPFMMRDGSYTSVRDLKSGDSLMPASGADTEKNIYIESIREYKKSWVYDLTTEKNHNFAVRGKASAGYLSDDEGAVFVHNSMPEIGSALDIYADECCARGEDDEIIKIESPNTAIREALEILMYDVLNIDHLAFTYIRNLSKYGDQFLLVDHHPDYGILNLIPMPVNEVEREEGFDPENPMAYRYRWVTQGNRVLENWQVIHIRLLANDGFLPYGSCLRGDTRVLTSDGTKEIKDIQKGDTVISFDTERQEKIEGKVLDQVCSGNKLCYSLRTENNNIHVSEEHRIAVASFHSKADNIYTYKTVKELEVGDILLVNNNKTVNFERLTEITQTEEYPVYDIHVDNNNHNFFANGILVHNSVLEPARRVWRQLILMEDSVMVYRVVRSAERRVFYIDVGNVAPQDIPQYMEKVKAQLKKNQIVDSTTGRVDIRYNPMSVDEDYWVPTRGEHSSRIETLPGGQFTGDIEDLNYIQAKLFAALKIPKSYLGYEDDVGGKSVLSQLDIRFARTIQRIQRVFVTELNKIAIIHLYSMGYDGEDLVNFEISMANPSTIADMQRLELWRTKLEVASIAQEGMFDKNSVYKKIWKLTDEDIESIEEGRRKDKLFDMELEALQPPVDPNQEALPPAGGDMAPPAAPEGEPATPPPPAGLPPPPGEEGQIAASYDPLTDHKDPNAQVAAPNELMRGFDKKRKKKSTMPNLKNYAFNTKKTALDPKRNYSEFGRFAKAPFGESKDEDKVFNSRRLQLRGFAEDLEKVDILRDSNSKKTKKTIISE